MPSFDFTFDVGANPPTLISAEPTLELSQGENFNINMTITQASGTPTLDSWYMTFDSGTSPIQGHLDDVQVNLSIPSPATGTYFSDTLTISNKADTGSDSYLLTAKVTINEVLVTATSSDPIIEVTDG